jgi:predicted AAA+ superfamily ATPase
LNQIESITFWNPWWQNEGDWFQAVEREGLDLIRDLLNRKEILTITGVRRSGKSTVLHLLVRGLLKEGVSPSNILHLNLEDPAFTGMSLLTLYEKYLELMNPDGNLYLFLDEIQEVDQWQRDLRKLYDGSRHIKMVITGSNSSLLKGEYATLLTGRTLTTEIFPFSFREALVATGWDKGFEQHVLLFNKPKLLHQFHEYLKDGGFPEVVVETNRKLKTLLLKEYYNAILTRDVLRRYPVRQTARYVAAAHYLISNATLPFSPKGISPLLGTAQHTLEEYLGYLEDVYLFITLKHFSYSVRQQLTYPRKIYSIDNGFIQSVSFKFSEDTGRLLENLVLTELRRRGCDCYYWKGKKECDFLVRENNRVTIAIQVTTAMNEPKTRTREIAGIMEAMTEFGLSEGFILTLEDEETIRENGFTIQVQPVWVWCLA